jgi:2-succinyl-6-hydroxy-2,4-cyclohexadiene-1-carboxylate synthase
VLLHGFLGSSLDWQQVCEYLPPNRQYIALDLPGHGLASDIRLAPTSGFQQCTQLIAATLKKLNISRCHLVGYSLGGRIALHYALQAPQQIASLVLESAHSGLATAEQRISRQQTDKLWAQRFSQQPLVQVLHDWYQQAVFSSLNEKQAAALIKVRSDNNGKALAAMLDSTSLARQDNLIAGLAAFNCPCIYITGAQDQKFFSLASQLDKAVPQLKLVIFKNAGHNIHYHLAQDYAKQLAKIFQTYD